MLVITIYPFVDGDLVTLLDIKRDGGALISGSSDSTGSFGDGHFAEKLGIGTVSIPHGGVGGGRLSINGADSNVSNGPALQMTTDSDNYPLFTFLPYSHDNIAVYIDGYNEGGGG